MKIVYVTGCLGFIGSYITRKCLEKGWVVYGIDKCTYAANTELLEKFLNYANFRFEKADIRDLDHLYDCDYVINTAAESHVANSIISSDKFLETNILGTKNLLELIRGKQKNIGAKPVFLHFSTDEVYGDIVNGNHNEEDLLKPSNPYSASKAAADMLVMAWARTYDLRYVIVRPANNYGIGQYPEKLIPLAVKNLNRGRKICLHDEGEPYRCWLHADDTAAAIIKIIESGKVDEIYNISGHEEQKNIDTVKKIVECYGYDVNELEKYVDFSYSRQGQDVRYSVDDNKLQSLGWHPERHFKKEIQDIVDYYRKNFIW
jgi:dTDP-glucose 4,6-dehydratase|tara:strand:- start:1362 stop:2312 length:951 start_codon:yes stop_codon:yes gene_type:complete